MTRTSKIILSKGIKLDRSYKQVLSYTETNLLNLLIDSNHLVSSKSDYSFIRERGSIKVQETYSQCLKANYMAFQNPDYSNKWFFAFIDKVKYLSDSATEIYYTVDVWSTWFDYWNPKTCYIIRQHATTDGVGDNLIPEGLEHGEYVISSDYSDSRFSTYAYLLVTAEMIEQATPTEYSTNLGGSVMNGFVYYSNTYSGIANLVKLVTEQTNPENKVLYAYMIPNILIPAASVTGQYGHVSSFASPYTDTKKVADRPTSLDGYVPVNKKLLTYPYTFCLFQNLNGASNPLYFEYSGHLDGVTGLTDGSIYIRYFGVPSIGASVIAIPQYYKGSALKIDESLVLGKYPVLGWSEDAYTNWLTQNSVNHTVNNIKTGLEIVTGVGMTAVGAGLVATGAGAIAGASLVTSGLGYALEGGITAGETALEYYKHSLEPSSYQGNVNAGDILTATNTMGFSYNTMTITNQYARILDKYFTRYGYKQNAIQYPNMLHRENYNYIQIAKDSTTAYSNNHNNICVPATELESINNIFRSGVTVWNNHENFGDYSVTNNITQ